jgi:DNA replication protein DnaC
MNYCIQCHCNDNLVPAGKYHICEKCLPKIRQNWVDQINKIYVEFQHFDFEHFTVSAENKPKIETCKQFALRKLDRYGLLLFSTQVGNGKTHLAVATLKHWILNCAVPYYEYPTQVKQPYEVVSEPTLLLKVRSSYDGDGKEKEWDIVVKYSNVEFLIIDDVGKYTVGDSNFLQRVLYNIINERYMNHKLTIITSNKGGAELKAYLGDSTFDRICGMTGNKNTEIMGTSYRQKKKEDK